MIKLTREPTKKCGLCNKIKTAKDFHKRNGVKDGLQPYCKECRKDDNYGKR